MKTYKQELMDMNKFEIIEEYENLELDYEKLQKENEELKKILKSINGILDYNKELF